MFFNKKPEQPVAPASEENLEWATGGRRSQSARIIATSWFFKATPMLRYPGGRKVELTFEGKARLGTTSSVPVYGEIEVLDDPEPPRFLRDCWAQVPESVEGYAAMAFDKEALRPPQLNIKLYCTAEALDWVSRVLVTGFSAAGGRAMLDIDIGYPDEIGPNFWKERWQRETVQVLKWDVRASAERP